MYDDQLQYRDKRQPWISSDAWVSIEISTRFELSDTNFKSINVQSVVFKWIKNQLYEFHALTEHFFLCINGWHPKIRT